VPKHQDMYIKKCIRCADPRSISTC